MKTLITMTILASIFGGCTPKVNIYQEAIEEYIMDIYYREIPPFRIVFDRIEATGEPYEEDRDYIYSYNVNLRQTRDEAISKIKPLFDSLGIPMPVFNRFSPPDGARASYPISERESNIITLIKSDTLHTVQRVQCTLYLEGVEDKWRYPIEAQYELSQNAKICFGWYGTNKPLHIED